MQQIGYNLEHLRQSIDDACRIAGRRSEDITLVAVTKTVPTEVIEQAIALGLNIIGENRVQEATGKYPLIGSKVQWHLIGHLQSNKAKKAVEIFSLIHSIDSVDLARDVGRRAVQIVKTQEILLEVNTSGEPQKYGFRADEVIEALDVIKDIQGIKILGLMTVGPLSDDADKVRSSFKILKKIFDEIKLQAIPNIEMKHLSMGMSGDYRVAIEEGSTMIRVGSAIFGSRG
ncbi:MAG: YggS family pyridoxal phosphate-dependent enzyme [Candidatus Edwardsbacteria bacterium]|nr:YggS family pyridoxal phosphate-dependent enzyme [Candidatus Edwardsbacteria bacterium]MBU1576244.1 YggS family pyridoxal phosphate-dependent enzyme [Candidatus Edwardsbacteria bacterium]MBU2462587.1 YggS family pyridoxal phosphate-dependent enzyme [Candidatus Edwardsbacteria bacterium]MBU2594333.1 YggS family pyridoxal phosphate-dependent enzyme [Candidatus Edwardsbacteria bacterium]